MTIKLIAATLILGFGLLFGFQQFKSNADKKERTRRGRVPVAIEDAKANNQREVKLRAPIGFYAASRSLDDSLTHYTTLIAQPITQFTRLDPDSKEIETWYKFNVIDFLSQPKNAVCAACSSSRIIPPEIQPVSANEILLVRNTGTMVEEGVKITTTDDEFPDFDTNKKYLFFVSLDPATRIAFLELGPAGVSVVEADGKFSSLSAKKTKLVDELKARYTDMDQAKTHLRFRRFPE